MGSIRIETKFEVNNTKYGLGIDVDTEDHATIAKSVDVLSYAVARAIQREVFGTTMVEEVIAKDNMLITNGNTDRR